MSDAVGVVIRVPVSGEGKLTKRGQTEFARGSLVRGLYLYCITSGWNSKYSRVINRHRYFWDDYMLSSQVDNGAEALHASKQR